MDEHGKHGGGIGGSGGSAAGGGEAAAGKTKKKGLMRFVVTRGAFKRIGVVVVLAVVMVAGAAWYTASMPGESYRGGLPTATSEQQELAERLRGHVTALAGTVGGRSTYNPRTGAAAAKYLRDHLLESEYAVVNETFVERGSRVPNLEVVLHGSDASLPCVVVGAHYDTFQGTPGADDNASGCAAVLELARSMMFDAKIKGPMHERSIRFVLFVNEEPPAFQTENMGSWVYAKDLKARGVQVHAMLSIEAIGYYSDAPGSQQYPLKVLERLYPSTGDFIGFIGNLQSRSLVRTSIGAFRERVKFPSEGASLPAGIAGVGWSDHWAFWQEGWPAIMVTGTATFRNPNYHTTGDRPETLDYDRMSRVVEGLGAVVHELATAKRWP